MHKEDRDKHKYAFQTVNLKYCISNSVRQGKDEHLIMKQHILDVLCMHYVCVCVLFREDCPANLTWTKYHNQLYL